MSAAANAIHRYWTEVADVAEVAEKKRLFLAGLKERGVVKAGLVNADISRGTAYLWRGMDADFKREWDEIRENCHDEVRESIFDQAVSRKNIVASIFYAKHNCPEYNERVQVDIHVVQQQVEERIEQYRRQQQQLSLPPASTKDIINAALGLNRPEAIPVESGDRRDDHSS
jgi:hypothetical protein